MKHAFSLVELSIVLVILGLLVGGILSGKSLIRASELRSVTTQYYGFVSAVKSFKDKYFALPGDMTNATAFWGTNTNPGDCFSTDAKTCNGDGDNLVKNSGGNPKIRESFGFWQHLANAGLVTGQYAGDDAAMCSASSCPAARVGGYWYVQDFGTFSMSFNAFLGYYGHGFLLTGASGGSYLIFTPAEAWNIDSKMDDGKPATGKIVVTMSGMSVSPCTDVASSATLTANYLLSSESKVCSLYFRQSF